MRTLRAHPRSLSVVAILVAIAALVVVARAAGPSDVRAAFARFTPAWLVLAVGAHVVALGGYAVAYRARARFEDGPALSLRLAARLVLAGFGAQAPGGGFDEDTRALRGVTRRAGPPVARVLGLGALEWALLAPAACIAAIVLLAQGSHVQRALLWSWAIAVPVGFAVGLTLSTPERAERLTARGGWRAGLGRGLAGVAALPRLAARCPVAWLGLAVYWTGDIAAFYGALRCFGIVLPIGVVILAYATGYAATRRSLPLGGAGITEVLLCLALKWVGLPLAVAVPPVALYRLITFALPAAPALRARKRVEPLLRRGDHVAMAARR